jgi:hypothetical protein
MDCVGSIALLQSFEQRPVDSFFRVGRHRRCSNVGFRDFGAARTTLCYVCCTLEPVVPNVALRADERLFMADRRRSNREAGRPA